MYHFLKNRYLGLVVAVWFICLLYMGFFGSYSESSDNVLKLEMFEKVMNQLQELQDQNKKLIKNFNDLRKVRDLVKLQQLDSEEQNFMPSKGSELSMNREVLRRRVKNDIRETWFYMHNQLESLKKYDGDMTEKLEEIQKEFFQFYSITANDEAELADVNGGREWRLKQSQMLSSVLSDVIDKLQNPEDCKSAKMLLCTLDKGCGFGCQVHHLLYCFITAIATNRTMLINSKGWRYFPGGWHEFFRPMSSKCDLESANYPYWTGSDEKKQVIKLPIIDVLQPRPDFLPLAVPKEFYNTLATIHGDPFVWWAGQLCSYILRPQPSLARDYKEMDEKIFFSSAEHVVGIHVRRTDKLLGEAEYHSIEQYMWHVERYYDKLDMSLGESVKRVIFLATDEPSVFEELQKKYPTYTVMGSKQSAIKAGYNTRYKKDSLKSVMMDIHFLSKTNYLVCTFSSQVCRLAYELMQSFHNDDAQSFTSLDDLFYYGGQSAHRQVARFNDEGLQEGHIPLVKGQKVGVAGNHWNGYSMGTSESSLRRGLYPSIKVLEVVPKVSFKVIEEYMRSKEFRDKYSDNQFASIAYDNAFNHSQPL